jgi:menaquinol-cytochrome c reductase iron-sulfur subunit
MVSDAGTTPSSCAPGPATPETPDTMPARDATAGGGLAGHDPGMTRGRFLALALGVVTAAIAATLGALGLPPLVAPALRRESREWVALGRLGAPVAGRPGLPAEGMVARVTLTRNVKDGYLPRQPRTTTVFVANRGNGQYAVFDSRCTHVGCPLTWDQAANRFRCPCHGAVFDARGRVVDGPAPRGLDRYEWKVIDDVLYVGGLERA